MQSATEAWKRAVSSGGGVIWLVEIKSGSTTWKAVTGGRPFDGDDGRYPPTIDRVTGAGSRLNPLTRASSVNSITVVGLDDRSSGVSSQGWLRSIIINNECKGARVRIWLGHHDLAESDFLIQGTYMIDDWIPAPGVIELRCLDPVGAPLDVNISGGWQMQHPLDVANDVLVHMVQIPTELYTDGSISHADTESHWNCTRADLGWSVFEMKNAIKPSGAIQAKKLLEEIAFLMGGAILSRESGEVEYVDYDKTSAAVRSWNVNEANWNILETKRTVINQIDFTIVKTERADDSQVVRFKDSTSQTDYRFPGSTKERIFSKGLTSPWLNGIGWLGADIVPTDTEIQVVGSVFHGFCGCRINPGLSKITYESGLPVAYQDADAQLNGTTRTAYLLISSKFQNLPQQIPTEEIMKATQWVADPLYYFRILDRQTGTSRADQLRRYKLAPDGGVFTVTRGQDGTAAGTWRQSGGPPVAQNTAAMTPRGPTRAAGYTIPVYDITIARTIALRLLERASNGLPRIRMQRPLRDADIQIADTVSITGGEDLFLSTGQDGVSISDTWEVIGKAIYAAEGYCDFELALKINNPISALSVDSDPDGVPGGTVNTSTGPLITVEGYTIINELGGTIMRHD